MTFKIILYFNVNISLCVDYCLHGAKEEKREGYRERVREREGKREWDGEWEIHRGPLRSYLCMKYLHIHNISIHINVYQNQSINECARKLKFQGFTVLQSKSFLLDVEKLTFLKKENQLKKYSKSTDKITPKLS